MTRWHPSHGVAEPLAGLRRIVHLPTRSVIGWSVDRSAITDVETLDALLTSALRSASSHRTTGMKIALPWCPTVARALGSESHTARVAPEACVSVVLPSATDRTEFDLAVRHLTSAGVRACIDFDGDVASIVALHERGMLEAVRLRPSGHSLTPDTPALSTRLGLQLIEVLSEAGVMVIVTGVDSTDVATRLRRAGVRFAEGVLFEGSDPMHHRLLDEIRHIGNAPMPADELERLDMVTSSAIVSAPPDPAFDSIVRIVSRRCATPMAAMTIIDHDRRWFKASTGLDITQTPRSSAFCAHAITNDGPMIVPDALADPRFATNRLVLGEPFVRSYLGVPLRASNGLAYGALCAIDTTARTFDDDAVAEVAALARLVTDSLELRRHHREHATAG